MKFKKGDTVIVTAGKDKGKEGKIERVYAKSNKVLVENINMYKKTVAKNEQMPQGGILDVPRPIDVSKIMFKDPKTGKPTRMKYETKDKKKVRVAVKSKTVIK